MSVRGFIAVLLLLTLPQTGLSQGFAGMGGSAEGYALPRPGTPFRFPADHGPHPEFRIEWWYLTANLTGADGVEYGIQWTLFRSALAPPGDREGAGDGNWQDPTLWMGHAAITTPDAHYVAERFARGGIGQAGVRAEPFEAWIDDWAMTGITDARLTARGADFAYDLGLEALGPFVLQGDAGYSVKSETGQASLYYSQPFYRVTGTLDLPDGPVEVTGQAWLDREWSSQPLTADQTGWDWVSLHFDDGAKLMGYRLRSDTAPPYTVATWIAPDGTPTPYPAGVLQAIPVTISDVGGRAVPTGWRLILPDRGLDVTVQALNPQSWMSTAVSYWEGPVRIEGSRTGRGYLEMTGYE